MDDAAEILIRIPQEILKVLTAEHRNELAVGKQNFLGLRLVDEDGCGQMDGDIAQGKAQLYLLHLGHTLFIAAAAVLLPSSLTL